MSQVEQKLHFLDLDWTITLERLKVAETNQWSNLISLKNAKRNGLPTIRLSPEKAANLIRLLQQAIAQAYEWERSEPAATD
jgi:hypothetical protein